MNNKKEIEKRILKGIEYFWKLKPSELSYIEKSRWTMFLKLLKLYFDGEDITIQDLRTEPRYETYESGKEVFENSTK